MFTFGRTPDNDFSLADPRMSGKHCRIMRKIDDEGQMIVIVEDTSSNGTFINGQLVSLTFIHLFHIDRNLDR